jgi:hypothetical protein
MKSVRRLSLLRFPMLTLLAPCLSAGLANAQAFKGQSTVPFETRLAMPTLPEVSLAIPHVSLLCRPDEQSKIDEALAQITPKDLYLTVSIALLWLSAEAAVLLPKRTGRAR